VKVLAVLFLCLLAINCYAGEQHAKADGENGFMHAVHELWHSMVPALGAVLAAGIGGLLFYRDRQKRKDADE